MGSLWKENGSQQPSPTNQEVGPLSTGQSSSGTAGANGTIILTSDNPINANASGIRTKQAVTNVNDTTPTDAELDTAFGTPASLGRGFIGLVDDNDADTIGYIAWTTDASWFWIIGTKAT